MKTRYSIFPHIVVKLCLFGFDTLEEAKESAQRFAKTTPKSEAWHVVEDIISYKSVKMDNK